MEEHFGFIPSDTSRNEENDADGLIDHKNSRKIKFSVNQKEKVAKRKEIKKKKQDRKKRLIIRNLSFKVGEKLLNEVFSEYGNVVDVVIPKKPDGKARGFAFVQYENFMSAINAVKHFNYKTLKGRPIAVDYAIAKDKYQHITSAKHTTGVPVKRSNDNGERKVDEIESGDEEEEEEESYVENTKNSVKDVSEDESVSDEGNDNFKEFMKKFDAGRESFQNDDVASVEPEESHSTAESSSESDNDSKDSEQEEEEEDDDSASDLEGDGAANSGSKRNKITESNSPKKLPKKNFSSDVNEGKTIFIRNISFDTNEDTLKKAMEEFGPVKYCLLCIDQFTELPKGTAFVKFENKEDAEKVIEKSSDTDGEGFYLDGRPLSCTVAVSQEELQRKRESSAKTGKDKRNLYLLKEGLIRSGSDEAEGVSQSDMARRTKMEILKRNKLKNLQHFVSDKRLSIHNIPTQYTDNMLRKLFQRAAGSGAKITEAKIIKNLKQVNPQGICRSKGYGFVAFQKHEDALRALREINNNPDVFTPQKRPIVEFSVENMNALLTKQRRTERSKMKMKKQHENSGTCNPEDNVSSLKFNKKSPYIQGREKHFKLKKDKKMHVSNSSDGNVQHSKSKSGKNKKKNKSNSEKKQMFEKHHNNNSSRSPLKEKSQKKKKNKHQRKSGNAPENNDSGNFTQMVNKYKQKLLSSM